MTRIPAHGLTEGLPPSRQEVALTMSTANDAHQTPQRQHLHRHAYYEILWLKDSYGTHEVDFCSYPFRGSVVFLLSPEQVHVLHKQQGTMSYTIRFSEQFFVRGNDADNQLYAHFLFDQLLGHPVISIPAADAARIETLLELTYREYQQPHRGDDILFAYLRVLLLEIIRLRQLQFPDTVSPSGQSRQQFLAFKQLLERHYTTQHEVQHYATLLHITPRQLNTLVQHMAGRTAVGFIKDRIMLEAKRLLFIGEQSIKEIGYELGFEDPAYFTRFFKKHSGMAPGQFREESNAERGDFPKLF